MRTLLVSVAALAALVASATAVQAQGQPQPFDSCGDTENLVLVFLNPDLQKRDDGLVHASGRFFVQLQARGPKAMDIDKLYFSFGKPAADTINCDVPEWYTQGVYLKNYRADFNWKDGFFIPINTYNVVDGEYIASMSAYDATGKELVRYWTKAVVENGCSAQPCETAANAANDRIMPWPIVLPGDGVRVDGKSGLYIEVAEPVADIKAWLGTHDGQKLLQLTNATPPFRDDDLAPDVPNNPAGPTTLVCPEAVPTATPQCAKRWGPAWEWDGVIGDEAVIRVRITDLQGNVAEKVLHVGDPTIGGRVTAGNPELQFVLDAVEKETNDDGRATWNVVYKSVNDDGVHGDVFVRKADGTAIGAPFSARLTPNHVMMGGMEQRNGTVTIIAGPDAAPGDYEFHLVVNYLAAEARQEKHTTLKLKVVSKSSSDPERDVEFADKSGEEVEATRGQDLTAANTSVVTPEAVDKDTPGPAPLLLAGAAAAAAAFARRRR